MGISKPSPHWSRNSYVETVRPERKTEQIKEAAGKGGIKARSSCERTADPQRGASSETERIQASFRFLAFTVDCTLLKLILTRYVVGWYML